jgi:hypothetical protein
MRRLPRAFVGFERIGEFAKEFVKIWRKRKWVASRQGDTGHG